METIIESQTTRPSKEILEQEARELLKKFSVSDKEIERRKTRLSEYKFIKNDFEFWVLELERLNESKVTLTKVLTGMPSSNVGRRPDSRWDEILDDMDEITDYLRQQVHLLLNELEALERAIDALHEPERTILTARYITGLSFNDIVKKMPMTDRNVYYYHTSGLKHINMSELDKIRE